MITRRSILQVAASACLAPIAFKVFGGCTKGASEPLDPIWGKEPCAHCNMIVSDRRYAAQVMTASSDRKYFDDIGCMVLWIEEQNTNGARTSPANVWVHDSVDTTTTTMSSNRSWVDAKSARYVRGAKTPMDF